MKSYLFARLSLALIIVSAALAIPDCTIAADAATGQAASAGPGKSLAIVGWGGATQAAHKDAYFTPFTAKTGVAIEEYEWNGEMAKIRAMSEAGNVSWDVVQVEAPEVIQGCEEGIFEKLDWNRIEGGEKALVEGAAGECGAGVLIWSTVFAYDANKLVDGPQNWAQFWDTATWPGKRGMRRGAKMTLEVALLADGVKRENVYRELASKAGADRAFAKLDQIKSDIVWWKAGAEPQELLTSGKVSLSMAYNAWVYKVNKKDNQNLKIVWDGNNYSMDYWVIVKGSKKVNEAYKFISLSMQPDRQAVFFNKISYGWTAKGTGKSINREMMPHLPTAGGHLDNALQTNADFWLNHGFDLENRFKTWLEAK